MATTTAALDEAAGRDLWKSAATALVAVVVALAGYSVRSATASGPSRGDVEKIVQTESPYVADRGVIRLQLQQQTAALNRLSAEVQALRVQLARR